MPGASTATPTRKLAMLRILQSIFNERLVKSHVILIKWGLHHTHIKYISNKNTLDGSQTKFVFLNCAYIGLRLTVLIPEGKR